MKPRRRHNETSFSMSSLAVAIETALGGTFIARTVILRPRFESGEPGSSPPPAEPGCQTPLVVRHKSLAFNMFRKCLQLSLQLSLHSLHGKGGVSLCLQAMNLRTLGGRIRHSAPPRRPGPPGRTGRRAIPAGRPNSGAMV